MLISIVNIKGGTAKTMSSIMLATALKRRGKSVIVLDADPQASAIDWAEKARKSGTPLEFPVEAVTSKRISQPRAQDVVIVDCPPGDRATIGTAIRAADFAIIPTGHSGADEERVWHAASECLLCKTPYKVLITRARPNTRTYQDFRDQLISEDASAFTAFVPLREGLSQYWGTNPLSDLFGYEQVLNELIEDKVITL